MLYISDGFTEDDGFAILGPTKDGYSGFSVSTILDINNDNYADMIIGVYGANNFAGTTYMIYGASSGFVTPSPTFAPTTITEESPKQNSIIENNWFQVVSSAASFVLSAITGWVLREKIIFYILNNWGYDYKLLHHKNDFLQPGDIGFTLVHDKHKNLDRIICKHGDSKIKVEIDNGINHGLPEGIYNLILQELKEPSKSFEFLQSEKNKILNFLLSRPGFVDFTDLGYIKGNVYKNLLNTNYKQKHEDKYKFYIRNSEELERFSYASDKNSIFAQNPLSSDTQTQDIEDQYRGENNNFQEKMFLIRKTMDENRGALDEAYISGNVAIQSKAILDIVINSIESIGECKIDSKITDGLIVYLNKEYSDLLLRSLQDKSFTDTLIIAISIKFYEGEIYSYIKEGDDTDSDIEQKLYSKMQEALKIALDELTILEKEEDYIDNVTERKSNYDIKEIDKKSLEVTQKTNNSPACSPKEDKKACIVMSIDAMIEPEHVRLQNEAFTKFANQLMNFLLPSEVYKEKLLPETNSDSNQAIVIYEELTSAGHSQFSYNNLVTSALNAKQILHNLPLLHYITQNAIDSLGYNISLPEPSDNKAILVSLDLVLGNAAAQYLPAESVMNAIFVSTASSISFGIRLTAADYLKNQEISDEPIEFAQQCGLTILAHSLPNIVNYAFAKAFLPNAEMSTLDMLGSSSFGVVQCYNNYKSAYEAEASALNTVVPYIADALTLWTLKDYMTFDTSSVGSLTVSIKNAISVAATTYAAHCVSDVMTDFIPQGVQEYIDTAFSHVTETATDIMDNLYDSLTDGIIV